MYTKNGLYYERRGAGAQLLMLSGMAQTHLHWGEPLLSRLAMDFDLVVYDYRGVGRSSPIRGAFTLVDLVDDALELIDELDWDFANVFGVSMGGMIAQEFALRHPDRISNLFLGGTRCDGLVTKSFGSGLPPAFSRAIVHGDVFATLRNVFLLMVSDEFAARSGTWEAYRDASLAFPIDPRVTVLQVDAMARFDTFERLSSIVAPTLVIHGNLDRLVDVEAGARITRAIKSAHFETVSAGHLFWLEQPSRIAQLIADFALI